MSVEVTLSLRHEEVNNMDYCLCDGSFTPHTTLPTVPILRECLQHAQRTIRRIGNTLSEQRRQKSVNILTP